MKFQADGSCLLLDADQNYVLGSASAVTTNSNTGRINGHCEAQVPNPTGRAITFRGFACDLLADAATEVITTDSHETITPDGRAKVECSWRKPSPDAYVSASGATYGAIEGNFTVPLADVGGEVTGDLEFVGYACTVDLPLPDLTGRIALIERGPFVEVPPPYPCPFSEKIGNAQAAGAIAAIVFDNDPGRDLVVQMAGTPVGIPGVFVSNPSGVALQSETSATIGQCRVTGKSLTCQGKVTRH